MSPAPEDLVRQAKLAADGCTGLVVIVVYKSVSQATGEGRRRGTGGGGCESGAHTQTCGRCHFAKLPPSRSQPRARPPFSPRPLASFAALPAMGQGRDDGGHAQATSLPYRYCTAAAFPLTPSGCPRALPACVILRSRTRWRPCPSCTTSSCCCGSPGKRARGKRRARRCVCSPSLTVVRVCLCVRKDDDGGSASAVCLCSCASAGQTVAQQMSSRGAVQEGPSALPSADPRERRQPDQSAAV